MCAFIHLAYHIIFIFDSVGISCKKKGDRKTVGYRIFQSTQVFGILREKKRKSRNLIFFKKKK